jgi:uncharacterized protein (TIGR00290 family)
MRPRRVSFTLEELTAARPEQQYEDHGFQMKRTLLSWSSGKDSAWSLHVLRQKNEYEIVGLLTTFNQEADRVAMHAVRRSLVEAQAKAAGIPLWRVDLPSPCSNQDYETIMREQCRIAVQQGIDHVAFGDLFLTDVRAYREKQLEASGLQPVFPLWDRPTRELGPEMIRSGLRAKLTCIDSKALAPDFVGREFDGQLLSTFPAEIDPCGENGEFHTFAYAGPMFEHNLSVAVGEIVTRDQFVFADLDFAKAG